MLLKRRLLHTMISSTMFNTKVCLLLLVWLCSSYMLVVLKVHTVFTTLNFFVTTQNIDTFGLVLFFTTLVILFICISISDTKYFNKTVLFTLFILFITSLLGLVASNNLISFFIFYELLLLPAYVLVRRSSPNRRSSKVANYFLLWTQFGSFLVLLGLFCIFHKTTTEYFIHTRFLNLIFLPQFLVFIGFAVKIPLWPFHFWLSKTHVEANTSFSIFLSGILVKAAVFGIYKFLPIFDSTYSWVFISITFVSIIDASFKMCIQSDLKKLVAFSTVQEMGFMVFLLLTPSNINYQVLLAFTVFHTLISAIFFWIVDCLYRRYGTRVAYNISGVSNSAPNLTLFIITSLYLFMGLPLTIKFSIEFHILKNLLSFNFFLTFLLIFISSYISVIFFFKTFLIINYGTPNILKILDCTKKEFIVFFTLLCFIFLINLA